MLLVHKYGGTSLADPDLLRRAAAQAVDRARKGDRVVLVASAQGDTTDHLLAKAAQVTRRAAPRELDACLAAGEQIAAALLAMAVEEQGRGAVSLTGWQAGIATDGVHGDARIVRIDTARLERALDAGKIVVVAGFQGLGPAGDVTTLGRGGSDTTAVALAAWLGADRCRIFTDVDGVYDRDPRRCPDAVLLPRVGYGQMLELIRAGAQVLHEPCVELARDRGIPIEVLSAFTGEPGTVVGDLE